MDFTLQLITTESCNLACKYCYMDHRSPLMKPETLDKILSGKTELLSKFNANRYQVSFFGGEPLLNWELIKYGAPIFHADELCKHATIISNGLELTQDRVDFIKNNGLGFSCSFDGLWNNDFRPLRTGESSFDRFFEKRHLIEQLTTTVKSMIHPSNVDTMTENLEFFVDKCDMGSVDFSLVRDDIWSEDDIERYRIELIRMTDRNIQYIKGGKYVLCGLYALPLADIMMAVDYGKRPFSCFAGVNGLAFGEEQFGYPCARYYSARKLPIYDIENKTFNEENLAIFNKEENNPYGHKTCNGCSLFSVCNTGCKFVEMDDDNRIEPIDSVCRLFHITYNETLRLIEAVKDEKPFKDFIKCRYIKENVN